MPVFFIIKRRLNNETVYFPVLVDVLETTKEACINFPAALTSAVWESCLVPSEKFVCLIPVCF